MDSCDTFVALDNVTKHKTVIFGKNSDRPLGEVQEVIFSKSSHPRNQKLQVGERQFSLQF